MPRLRQLKQTQLPLRIDILHAQKMMVPPRPGLLRDCGHVNS
jgi:hypothetical protein